MPSLRVTVNGAVQMDGDLGEWSNEPPFITQQKLAIASKRDEPWSIPLLGLIAKAATGSPIQAIDVQTRADGWNLSVTNRST